MTAPKEVKRLVERFRENREAYLSSEYNETQLRREFLGPFFKALGWDTDNEQGYAQEYKDVIHEDTIKIGGAAKAPAYAFRIGGTRKFFVETEPTSHDAELGQEQVLQHAEQLRDFHGVARAEQGSSVFFSSLECLPFLATPLSSLFIYGCICLRP